MSDNAGSIAAWEFFGPGRVAEVERGNGLIETFMNNDRTHSAVQETVANPAWGSADSDRLGYDGAGRMITKRFVAGGINSSTHAYEDTDPVVGFTTAFDRASNKLYERELHAEARSHLYEEFVSGDPQGGYDSLDRLRQYQRGTLASGGESISSAISLPNTDEQRDYILDGLGNWKETDYTPVGGSLVEETRNHNKLNQITKRQPDDGDPWTNFTHDLNGNLLDDGVRLYEWDALNRLYEVKRKSDGTTIAKYAYNAATHRIRKTVTNGGLSGSVPNGETNFAYNSGWQCLEERDSSDALLRQYVWGIYIDELLQMREGTDDRYPLQDLLYRTTALADDTGAIVEAYDTDAYGNTLIFDSPGAGGEWWADDASQVDVPTCAFIFTGRRYDPETELYQYRHRYYASVWGRFVSRDPRGYVDGVALHAFVSSYPTGAVDPFGTMWKKLLEMLLEELGQEWHNSSIEPIVRKHGHNEDCDNDKEPTLVRQTTNTLWYDMSGSVGGVVNKEWGLIGRIVIDKYYACKCPDGCDLNNTSSVEQELDTYTEVSVGTTVEVKSMLNTASKWCEGHKPSGGEMAPDDPPSLLPPDLPVGEQ